MCPKNSKTPIFLIGGICFVIVLVAICGVTLINNINLSNIIRLNEKVASDSMATSNQQHQQYDDGDGGGDGDDDDEADAAGGESVNDYLAGLESERRLSQYTQSHPKNIFRFDKETGMMTEHHQQHNSNEEANRQHNSPEPPRNEMSAYGSWSPLGLWPNARIVDNDRNIDTLQVQEINAISMDTNDSVEKFSSKTVAAGGLATSTATSGSALRPAPTAHTAAASTRISLDNHESFNRIAAPSMEAMATIATTIATSTTTVSPVLVISDKNVSMIDYEKRSHVVKMMQHAWQNYKLYAWGKNELRPLSQRAHIGSIFGSQELGATIIDGLDTLYIMGLENEYKEGRDWIERKFSLDNVTADLSVFETNIRFIGGLLTMYAFTGDNLYKERAQHVADKLLPAFQTPTGIPYGLVNPKTGLSKNYGWASGASSILSEFGTLHLEFSYLSDITGNPLYKERVQTIRQILKEIEKPKGLYPNFLNPKTGKWGQLHMSLGALGDSFYEYLLKAWLQSGQTDEEARQMFDEAMVAIIDHMVRTSLNGLTYVSDLKFDRLEHKMDHLACFAGGLFALGANTRQNEHTEKFMSIGKGITNTCHESYIRSTTHLGPEAFRFSEAAEARALKSNEKYYILRPETVESYLVLWRLTHDQKYRDWGWDAVQALEQHCRTPHGYSGIKNVYQDAPQKDDVQQSFFLAETLKYLYLLFSDDSLIPLDEWVFNTEAHPLPIKGSNIYYRQAASTSAAATNAS
ncbi:mannosyl-oligosaccharide alpha-1,2-mannosidase IA isoform X2 [Stomoxys calcitrans]|uniref:mannosyl-oligosaccharide alpha-1,2-mannosidase IA isoform X2 n=1 Tax=Stomoxys calcitrans TaxID=35570 RepID=UPI0027E226EC|nr:mannosyl-oligosaccharide alpha-1,2-mannosidase IA isoform X2 [Stomoxys calcitrans]XP_013105227.2 mannosyl-oligosaccharide alpha-1,2-mannosidase IA isoform X2 [Stomoxys calcitrans]XP_013105228.2 mannosyl-oligosaccharide alpha-1,2-mannosidase IA isoform X2 [Stomoxys calcitrans]XP_059224295.1 mannosyl-oligosaccharide alpha-1,2-mannosidase IA isoform X2 [Stomoxys calcitrans]XP_059224296.1 mannosyl-oligosaccharide alpha-1,2-mannosidase IA isoform X2 [Stomoxys calcitrans]